jgi:hypothetical protein
MKAHSSVMHPQDGTARSTACGGWYVCHQVTVVNVCMAIANAIIARFHTSSFQH